MITWPTPHDGLTEEATELSPNTVQSPYGSWSVSGGVTLDTLEKVVGLKSVKSTLPWHEQPPSYPWHEVVIYLANAVNLTSFAQMHFWHKTNDMFIDPNAWQCTLIDVNGKGATIQFGTVVNQWEEKIWDLSQFTAEAGFDWSQIIAIDFVNAVGFAGETVAWWDDLFFYAEVPEGILRVESAPTGKTGTMMYGGQTYPFTTPAQSPSMPVGTEVKVSMDPTDFDKWQDGDTNPIRTEIIQIGVKTIKAFYTTAILPMLTIGSYDEKGVEFPGVSVIKLTYGTAIEFLNVPFGKRVGKGQYDLEAMDISDRTFHHWKKPDGTTVTDRRITIDIQTDTSLEVHWQKAAGIDWPMILTTAIIIIGIGTVVFFMRD